MEIREIQTGQGGPTAQHTAPTGGTEDFSQSLKQATRTVSMDDIFARASETYGVPLNLLKAVAKAESGFQADVTSRCGAMGVMQLMPGTAKSLGVTDPYDAEQNIMGGAKYLSNMLNKYSGNTSLALAAYNAGGGAVDQYDGIPPYPETQNYVKKVLSYMGQNLGSAGQAAVGVGQAVGLSTGMNVLANVDMSSVRSVTDLIKAIVDQEGSTSTQEAAQIYGVLSPLVQSQLSGGLMRGLFDDGEDENQQLQEQMRYLFL